ncbi:NUDIX hydrolase [archaeon]|nr:MAG: NUDIX hydrolase [archaeon]
MNQVLSEKTMYKSDWMQVILAEVKLSEKQTVKWDYIKTNGFIAIVAVDDKNNVYLVKEWRVAWKDYITQIPAGTCYDTTEEYRIEQVHNELREEIGMDARKVEKLLGPVPMSARENNAIHVYLATDLFESKKEADADEAIEVIKMPFLEAHKLLRSGKIMTTSYTMLGIDAAKERLGI